MVYGDLTPWTQDSVESGGRKYVSTFVWTPTKQMPQSIAFRLGEWTKAHDGAITKQMHTKIELTYDWLTTRIRGGCCRVEAGHE